jgi:hypothetical protein
MAEDADDVSAEHARLQAAVEVIAERNPDESADEHVALLMEWLERQPKAERDQLTRALMRFFYEDVVS